MKVILIGHPASQKIRKASEYLTKKYLPFEVTYYIYKGDINEWSRYIISILDQIKDKYVILSLDDYLISSPINMAEFGVALRGMDSAVLAKLCICSPQENEEYPVTTQYTLWNREFLISLLEQTTTPWSFEIWGSQVFKKSGKKMLYAPALKYHTNSSLSSRWEGVDLKGLNEEDIKKVQELF